jgi:hypothetical protein
VLPEFHALRGELHRVLQERLVVGAREKSPFLSRVSVVVRHEGDDWKLARADGTIDSTAMKEHEISDVVTFTELETLTLEGVLEKIDAIASRMLDEQTKTVIETLDKAAKEVGNVVHGGGKPLSADLLYEVLEKREVDFSEPNSQAFWTSPAMGARLEALLRQIQQDPEQKARFESMWRAKYEQWRLREADRELA